jgi:flagellar FliJ protein
MARGKGQLDRILRVRTLQLGMTRAEEVRAHAKIANEADLADRIAKLADSVAPAPAEAGSGF